MPVQELIKVIPDYPKEGVFFRHIAPLIADRKEYLKAIDLLFKAIGKETLDKVQAVVVPESRGFILGETVANKLRTKLIMIRKPGKLPGDCYEVTYSTEYSKENRFQLEKDSALKKGDKVIFVDDVLAGGGTCKAGVDLLTQAGCEVVVAGFLIGLGMGGEDVIKASVDYDIKVVAYYNYPPNSPTLEYRAPPIAEEYRPVEQTYLRKETVKDKRPLLMWLSPALDDIARKMLNSGCFRASYISWGKFDKDMPNIEFEPSETTQPHHVVFLFSGENDADFFKQLSMLVVLPRQLIRSLTILIPFFAHGTHERVVYSGMLASAETYMKILSASLPMTRKGPPVIRILDIHALPIRFYADDNVHVKPTSALPLFLEKLEELTPRDAYGTKPTIILTDEGAKKRYGPTLKKKGFPTITFNKRREGLKRTLYISEIDEHASRTTGCILDDLVRTGRTILEAAKKLKEDLGFKEVNVFVTHADFVEGAVDKFTDENGLIDTFFITDSVAESSKLKGVKPFVILPVAPLFTEEVMMQLFDKPPPVQPRVLRVFVATTNKTKLDACMFAFHESRHKGVAVIHQVSGISSGVPEQPFGVKESGDGARKRLINMMEVVEEADDTAFLAIESGIIKAGDEYFDEVFICYKRPGCQIGEYPRQTWLIPKEHYDLVEEAIADPTVTFGSRIEKKYGFNEGTWHKRILGKSRFEQISESLIGIDLF